MSDLSEFLPPGRFDPATTAMLSDLYDRACARYCRGTTDEMCPVMADKLISAAMGGERNPDSLWQITVRGF